MKNNNKIIYIVITVILFSSLLNSTVFAEKRPKYSEHVYYNCPDWLSDTEIVYVKDVSHFSYHYDWLSSIANAFQRLEKRELQICSLNLDTGKEKIIKNIVIRYRGLGNMTVQWEDKTFEGLAERIINLSSSPKNNIIVFAVSFADNKPLFIINSDGTGAKKILNEALYPRISPAGDKVLYGTNNWNLDIFDLKSGEINKLTDNAAIGIWNSIGDKVIYVTKDDNNYSINLSSGAKEYLAIQHLRPESFSPSGTKIICGGGIFSSDGKMLSTIYMPNNARFSPNGDKIIGTSMKDVNGDICVINSDGTQPRALKANSIIDH